jgi:hypothetical protein
MFADEASALVGRPLRMRMERFLDYGLAEVSAYVQRAVVIGDSHRLVPEVQCAFLTMDSAVLGLESSVGA